MEKVHRVISHMRRRCIAVIDSYDGQQEIERKTVSKERYRPEFSTVDYLQSTDYLNLLTTISASCYCAQSLLDVSYCTRWITLISRLL